MIYTEQEARALIIEAGHKLVEEGLVARTWGNISARVSQTHFLITPSGRAYETLQPEELVLVKIEDCTYEGGIKPSSEKGVHAAAYRHRSDVNFVIHTHQDYASCIGVANKPLTGLHHPILGDTVACAAYGMPSTKKLKNAVEQAIVENPAAKAVLMPHHGAVCMAADFDAAFAVARSLEEVSEEIYRSTVMLPEEKATEEAPLLKALRAAAPQLHFGVETHAAVQAVAAKGETLLPHLDDLAQIAGTTVRCVKCDPGPVLRGLKHRAAVLVEGVGAVCCTEDSGDLEAVAAILRKSCMTALYAEAVGASPLSGLDRRIMRTVYTMKYSKKKTEK